MISRLYKVRDPEDEMRNVKDSIRKDFLARRKNNLEKSRSAKRR